MAGRNKYVMIMTRNKREQKNELRNRSRTRDKISSTGANGPFFKTF